MSRVDAAVSLLLIGGALITELPLIFALAWLWTHRLKPWLRALAWRHRLEWQAWADGIQQRQDDRLNVPEVDFGELLSPSDRHWAAREGLDFDRETAQ